MSKRLNALTFFCTLLLACFVLSSPLQAQDQKPININTAPVEVLTELDGIGETLAQRIIDYRQEQPFESIEEIMEVKGIGQGTFENIKDHITIE
ncbi:MAG: helix-hairpin-helix domain-containing protein [Desulfovermiculus sp.]|nr:helix-hairpin-helix domain-containing protein [Desulfovermiculus sp.]